MMKKLLLSLFLLPFTVSAQDSCAGAIALPMGTSTVGTINGAAIPATAAGGCWGTTGTAAEWYTYTATSNGVVRINTNLPINDGDVYSDDTRISVFTGTCAALTCYNGSDDVDDLNYLTDFEFLVEAGTTYYVAFDNRWLSDSFQVQVTFTAANCPSSLPYAEDFSTMLKYACWKSFNINNDGIAWQYNDINDLDGDDVNDPIATVFSLETGNAAKNEWLISKGLDMTAGTTYNVSVTYNALTNGPTQVANESFRTVMLDSQSPTATNQSVIGTATGITQQGTFGSTLITSALTSTYPFTPTSTGTYYLGLHANTPTPAGIFIVLSVNVVTAPLSTGEFSSNSFKVYPNPSNNIVTISSDSNILLNAITITDLNGRTVKSVKLDNVNDAQINISDLASGVYMMNISSDQGTAVKKIIKN